MNNQNLQDKKFTYIQREQIFFSSSADQRKISFKELDINTKDIQSFAITFTFSYTNSEEIKDDLIFFQTGPSTMKKDFIIGLHPGRILFVTFNTKKGAETLYSQISLRPNQVYYFAFVIAPTPVCMDVSLYINGQCESQISLFQGCDMPKGWFFLGSEQANKCFRGMVKDAIFFIPALNSSQVLEVYTNRNMAQDSSSQQGVLIAEEQLEKSMSYSKKKGVPINVVKNFMIGDASNTVLMMQGNSMITRLEDDNLFGMNTIKRMKYFTNKTREYLIENQDLMDKCREVALWFDWIFTTLWVMSPTIEEAGPAFSLPFGSFQTQVVHYRFDSYPVYVIEFHRFLKVMNQLDVKLSKEEIFTLARLTNSYKNSKSLGEMIFYNRFLISLRNASLTKEEIRVLKRTNKNIDQEEEDDMFSRPLLNDLDGRIESYGKFLVQEAKVGFDCGTKLQDILTDIRPQSISIKILSEAEVFPQQEEIEFTYRRISTGEMISLKFPFNNPKKEDDFTTQIKLEFEEGENIQKIIMKFDTEHQILVGISFFTNNGKTYYLPLAQTATFASLGRPTEEHTISIESDDFLLGFFGNLVERKDTSRVYLGGFGAHVLKAVKDTNTQEDEKEEDLPLPNPDWNQGRIQLMVEHCFDCTNHKTTTWHEEADFVEKFNELIIKLREVFTNLEGVGNYNPPKIYENFNVYIRGVGSFHKRDEEGRILLYEKSESLKVFHEKFLDLMLPVYDGICLLIASYGTSKDLEIAQENYLSKYTPFLPPRSRYCHEFPANVPDRPSKIQLEHEIHPGTDMVCKNWACGKRFKFDDNPLAMESNKCRHHPGKYEAGSLHGLWPESWSCCRGSWEDQGCKTGKHHNAVPVKKRLRLCINHGDINPVTKRPDSVCGKSFKEEDPGDCIIHSGFLQENKKTGETVWTCCQGNEACFPSQHNYAEWPEPAAKLYFVQLKPMNPGIVREYKQPAFTETAKFSGVFKETKPYNFKTNEVRAQMRKQIDLENEPRYCLNWACEREFTDAENKKRRHCLCHPGTWDFGHTGITVSQAYEEYQQGPNAKFLWNAHWTCCREKGFDAKGCTRTFHKGPYLNEMKERKYKWPSEHAQKYLHKRISEFWQKKLQSEHLDSDGIDRMWPMLIKFYGSGGKISTSRLPLICDKLKLHLFVISEDLSYHYKFMDIMTNKAQVYLDDGWGNINLEKFKRWWGYTLDEIRPM